MRRNALSCWTASGRFKARWLLRALFAVLITVAQPASAVLTAQVGCATEEESDPVSGESTEPVEEAIEAVPQVRRRQRVFDDGTAWSSPRRTSLVSNRMAVNSRQGRALSGSEHGLRNGLGSALRC